MVVSRQAKHIARLRAVNLRLARIAASVDMSVDALLLRLEQKFGVPTIDMPSTDTPSTDTPSTDTPSTDAPTTITVVGDDGVEYEVEE